MAGRFELKRSGRQFMWNLIAANGRVILTSERYHTRGGARKGIASVRRNGRYLSRYERTTARGGAASFLLRAANGEIIGTGQRYASASGRNRGIRSVVTHAPAARIVDLTV